VTEPFLDDEGVPAAPEAPASVAVEEHLGETGLEHAHEHAHEHEHVADGGAEAGGELESAAGEPAEGAPRRSRLLAVLCVVLAVAVLGLALAAAAFASRLHAERSSRQQVEDVSGRFAAALLTYDYTNLDPSKKKVLSLSTGKFQKEYEQAFTGGLDTLFKETQARSAGTVNDVFVGEIDHGTVTSIVVVDAVAAGTSGTRRLVSSYIELQLVKVNGAWKVDGVTNLNLGAAGSDTPGLTTATTAPAK
jgi:Mce-associated membrane protein